MTTITIDRLSDPVVEQRGFPVTSYGAECYWLPTLGPTAMWLLRAAFRHTTNGPWVTDADDLAASLGVAERTLVRNLERLARRGIAVQDAPDVWRVRTHLADLTERQVARLPEALRESWQQTHGKAAA